MPSLHGGPRPKSRFWRYAALLFFPLAMVTMMISFMLGAMFQPTPRDMPVAVAGPSIEQAQATADGLDRQLDGYFDFHVVGTAEQARAQVQDREAAGAFVLPSAQSPQATVLVNQAANSSSATLVERIFTQVAQGQDLPVATEDVAPLPAHDSAGVVSMYIAMGWIMSGFLVVVVGANAAPTSRPLRRLLPLVGVYSVFMSAVTWLIAGPITGSISGHFWTLLAIGIVAITCTAMFSAVLERLFGMLSVVPIVAVLMFLGVPASNGAMSVYMEPGAFRWLHDVLPMPAGVESARSILYFGGDGVGGHLLVFALWGAISLAVVALIDRIKPLRTETPRHLHPEVVPAESAAVAAGSSQDTLPGREKELVDA